ncbi:MAG: hypothetical protein HXK63_09075, partial [Campylobacter sp.]|nr:hypothetical protein [Campylobacter sp.]
MSKLITILMAVLLCGCTARGDAAGGAPYAGYGVKFFGDSHLGSDALIDAFRRNFFVQNSVGIVPAMMPRYHANENV